MKISMGDFVKLLITILQKNGIRLLFKNHEPWHLLFYKLKSSPELQKKPFFFDTLRFDWDGRYPKSPELSEFLHGLRVTRALICDSPQCENYRLSDGMFMLLEDKLGKLDEATRMFLDKATDIACREFTKSQPIKK